MNPIQRVAIVGGTHGNEFTGAYLIKKFEQYPERVQRSSFSTQTLLANPQAFADTRRYIDRDLNRSFLSQDLQNPNLSGYEAQRAKAIAQQLGIKGSAQVDVVLDLHSTTANMGLSLLMANRSAASLQLASYVSEANSLVKVCLTQPDSATGLLRSLSELGVVIEVGPVAQGVLDAYWFQQTEALIHTILDYLHDCNQGTVAIADRPLTFYEPIGSIDYPRNKAGEIQAMIHPELQGKDYQPLKPGDPLFLKLDGSTIVYEGVSTVYPIFINEAAYYEKGIALTLTHILHLSQEDLLRSV